MYERDREKFQKKTEGGEERLRAVVDVLHVLVHGWPGVRRSFIRRLKQKSSRVGGASVNNAREDRRFFLLQLFLLQHKFRNSRLQNLVFRRRHGDAEAHVGRRGSVFQCYKPSDI
jgi:hypothetical protein